MANDLARWQFARDRHLPIRLRRGDGRPGLSGRGRADRLVPAARAPAGSGFQCTAKVALVMLLPAS